jgi:putative polyketide hydroxylase
MPDPGGLVERTSVFVVGGGLVGLSAAVFLAHRGVEVVLAERRPTTSLHPKARGLNIRTMELYRQVGLEDAIRGTDSAGKLAANNGFAVLESLSGRELAPFRQEYMSGGAELSPTGWCLCDQDEVEPLLAKRAVELGADIRFGTEVLDLTEDETGVTATLPTGEVRADHVIVADGAHSRLRERWGITSSGPGTLSRTISVYFKADLREALGDRRFILAYVNNAEVRAALAPVDNAHRWLLHVPYFPDKGQSPEQFDEQRCTELVRAAAGIPDLDVEIVQVLEWEAAGRVADTYRHGRAFLAGDAAHVMPPSGAFGSNTGIQDVHNLAWRLALVAKGAGPKLLDGYEAERRPVGISTMRQAVARSKDRPRVGREEEANAAAAIVPDHLVQLGYAYPEGDFREPDGRPGGRVPHVWIGDQVSTVDSTEFVLVSTKEWPAIEGVRRISADPGFAESVLIRPDGFVAWTSAGSTGDPADALQRILNGG